MTITNAHTSACVYLFRYLRRFFPSTIWYRVMSTTYFNIPTPRQYRMSLYELIISIYYSGNLLKSFSNRSLIYTTQYPFCPKTTVYPVYLPTWYRDGVKPGSHYTVTRRAITVTKRYRPVERYDIRILTAYTVTEIKSRYVIIGYNNIHIVGIAFWRKRKNTKSHDTAYGANPAARDVIFFPCDTRLTA